MKKAAALILLGALVLGLAACGAAGEGRALELARRWDETRLWGCRYEAACAGELFVLSVRPEGPDTEGLSVHTERNRQRTGTLGGAAAQAAAARELYGELSGSLGGGWDVLIVFYGPGGSPYGIYLNGERRGGAAV